MPEAFSVDLGQEGQDGADLGHKRGQRLPSEDLGQGRYYSRLDKVLP